MERSRVVASSSTPRISGCRQSRIVGVRPSGTEAGGAKRSRAAPAVGVPRKRNAARRAHEADPGGHVPDARRAEERRLEDAGGDEGALQRGRSRDPRVQPPQAAGGSARRGPEAAADTAAGPSQRGRLTLEAQRAALARVVDARPQRVRRGAPDRAHDGPPAMQHADRAGEEREAVDEVRGPVDGVEHPDELAVGLGGAADLLADHAVVGKALGDALAQQRLDGAVGLGNRVGRGSARGAGLVLVLDDDLAFERVHDALPGEPTEFERGVLDRLEAGVLGVRLRR